ncbi:E3 ubiquitin-protein ligase COP1-like isoform X2 [Malania oleifera]|uniref:E3 ubiquitin-protein ligase COP1-like isoform X2 n=1 Tax=Malania oleifera TaxID=397392 RepID=UPI0025AE7040|nr:E3 ubiquitin-protein ligase COP1-like isoform X2 [Malania oleifera]
MGESSVGALVPSVKAEPAPSSAAEPPLLLSPSAAAAEEEAEVEVEVEAEAAELRESGAADSDSDFLCPICMQFIKDAFLTACGHSFCYMCIFTHLRNKSDCPSCGHFLTSNQIFPNFLLNKLVKKTSAQQIAKASTPFERLRQALQQIQTDLQYIKEDINAVERHRIDLYRARERYSVKLRMLVDEPAAAKTWPLPIDKCTSGIISNAHSIQGWTVSSNLQNKKPDVKAQANSQGLQKKDAYFGSDSLVTQSGQAVARKRQVHAQFNDLQECYLQKRRHCSRQSHKQEEKDSTPVRREGYHAGLEEFQSVLTTFTRYSRLRVIAELRHGDLFHSVNIVSSIEFDRDDELFATAGVSRRIKVFEFSTVVNEPADLHCPIIEMSTRSKLSCLSWNKHTKNYIASSDYEGIVTVWDVTTRQSVMEYEEHEKRAWSVDFSRTEPSMLVSGSDDCKVKVWCTKQEASVLNIDMKANICSVKYNPGSSIYVAVGSADHHIHYYDLRNISQPLHVFSGHRKTVSYVKFLSSSELASASTDSTLRLWDVKENLPLRTFRGHTNEKNFVGLSVNSEYIACGSETNEVFVYHKAISKPAAWHRFGSSDVDDTNDDLGSYFISAVCWKSDSPTMLTANSQGTIKVLAQAA